MDEKYFFFSNFMRNMYMVDFSLRNSRHFGSDKLMKQHDNALRMSSENVFFENVA